MAREKKKQKTNNKTNNHPHEEQNPEIQERNRLKSLAHSNNLLSLTPPKLFSTLPPSKTVLKHHGKDIVKKSHRKNRYLFSFDGLLAPVSGGKIGELTHLGSKNPVLYLEFPQGRMKLLGTIVYPKNRYLTLQFSRGGKNVMCEDCFDNMVVFSEAYWVGKKEENPDEARLDFPEELYENKQSEFDFQGGAGAGAGAAVPQNKIARKPAAISIEEESISDVPLDEMETDSPEREDRMKDIEYTTPVRHSERTAGKSFKFAEVSSGDDSEEIGSDLGAEANEEAADEADNKAIEKNQNPGILETADNLHPDGAQPSAVQAPSSSKLISGENKSSRGSLKQPTISALFKKVDEKSTFEDVVKIDSSKAPKKSAQHNISKSKNKSMTIQVTPDAAEVPKEDNISQVKKARPKTTRKKQTTDIVEVEDDIEDVTSGSEENDDESDEDWRT